MAGRLCSYCQTICDSADVECGICGQPLDLPSAYGPGLRLRVNGGEPRDFAGGCLIGRGPSADVPLESAAGIRSCHAYIGRTAGGWVLYELLPGGTAIEHERVGARGSVDRDVTLAPGDHVFIGSTKITCTTSKPPAYQGRAPFVFVSYLQREMDRVYPVIREMQRLGIRIWYDTGLLGGQGFKEQVEPRIKAAAAVLLFLSENALGSPSVLWEVAASVRRSSSPGAGGSFSLITVEVEDFRGEAWSERVGRTLQKAVDLASEKEILTAFIESRDTGGAANWIHASKLTPLAAAGTIFASIDASVRHRVPVG